MNKHRIDLVLETWYSKDHPLHFDLHHPLGKLVGEWGELLDDYMKHLYKTGYDWQPLDELVDIWYYVRILAYQLNIELRVDIIDGDTSMIDHLISSAILEANHAFRVSFLEGDKSRSIKTAINATYTYLIAICNELNITIDQLTEASWEKLKPGSERGDEWTRNREEIK